MCGLPAHTIALGLHVIREHHRGNLVSTVFAGLDFDDGDEFLAEQLPDEFATEVRTDRLGWVTSVRRAEQRVNTRRDFLHIPHRVFRVWLGHERNELGDL